MKVNADQESGISAPRQISEHQPQPLFAAMALVAMFLVVAGSQWGMLFLSLVYSTQGGRADLLITPELVLGSIAILLSILLLSWCKIRLPKNVYPKLVIAMFVFFIILSTTSELLKPEINWRSISSLVSVLAYLVVGYACGHMLGGRHIRKIVPVLLLIFSVWYIGLIWLGASGHLSAQHEMLGGSNLMRLENTGGFAATELPIFSGMQLPLVLMVLVGSFGIRARVVAIMVLIGIASLLVLTASVGAIGASVLVVVLVLTYSSRKVRTKLFIFVMLTVAAIIVFGGAYLVELYFSVLYRIDRLSIGGGRTEIYSLVLKTAVENPLTGVGLSNFQHLNTFGQGGTGLYPHNNLLGIAAELGVFAGFTYLAFIFLFVWTCLRKIPMLQRFGFEDRAALLTAILGIFVYQQTRGILQDTWLIKEMYFWVGFAIGVLALGTPVIIQLIGHENKRATARGDYSK